MTAEALRRRLEETRRQRLGLEKKLARIMALLPVRPAVRRYVMPARPAVRPPVMRPLPVRPRVPPRRPAVRPPVMRVLPVGPPVPLRRPVPRPVEPRLRPVRPVEPVVRPSVPLETVLPTGAALLLLGILLLKGRKK